ncbi:phosphate transport system substrate-binding protein [Rhodoblastus acidophilus]|uniref:phosphate ABC transporter substrate-binding/OmpA family protein n=1 Tax=Rhodoblastus acidophilus TaxID=1074 RepID=UPI0022258DE4|nr:phosphate ABC transporter substrate-binding/OmpA family protein [Rhodoblastus acidophilus]MCW2285680.1 phosphate transport system substrate-binding protein [Rhodoblastus acidophilus]MCW2333052.1 phosphate transport system substrate-binding protein [Rhodoblastus acidophilus]
MNDKSALSGRCTNIPDMCSLAKAGTPQEMAGPDARCSECGSPLMIVSGPKRGIPAAVPVTVVVALLSLGGFGAWRWVSATADTFNNGVAIGGAIVGAGQKIIGSGQDAQQPPGSSVQTPQSSQNLSEDKNRSSGNIVATPAVPGAQCVRLSSYLVRLSGSNTVGGELAPNLAEAWLASKSVSNITKQQCADESGRAIPEFVVSGRLNGAPVGVEIKAHGTGTGVTALAQGDADIWMASAQVTDAQLETLAAVGVQRGGDSENIVGLDGIAIVTSPANPVSALSKAQIRAIFVGQIKDWREVGGTPGAIHLYARDKASGTRKTFDEMVLGSGVSMSPLFGAKPQGYDDNADLSRDVSSDAQGIGFVGMGYVKPAKAVAIGDGRLTPVEPTRFTVQKESYPLARRLYLYTSRLSSADSLEFVKYALGDGQKNANSRDTTPLKPEIYWPPRETVNCELSDQWKGDREEFCRLRARAGEISSSFTFDTASSKLDKLARANVLRVAEILRRMPSSQVVLVGFADSRGTRPNKCALSQKRAESVSDEFVNLGFSNIKSRGLCDELPIRDDLGEDFEHNRRVDVFVYR